MSFIEVPYLPKGTVKVAVGDIALDGVKVIKPYCIKALPSSMQYHADLSLCYLGRGIAVCAPEAYDYYTESLGFTKLKLIKGEAGVGSNYPYDAAYNVAIVGKRLYCKVKITDPVLLNTARAMGYEIININQGYAKCSVCPVDEKSAISADMSFGKAAVTGGLDVLLITNDNICLEGFENGFFGGCSYMAKKGELNVKGDFATLPHYEEIREFLKKRGISVGKGSGSVKDFGSFIPLTEE